MSLLDLDAIRVANPLPSVVGASVKLQRAGNEWKACCPFHSDRSPSFTIFADGQRFHCFGCGAGGDVLDYLQLAHSVDLREAAAMLAAGSVPVVAERPRPPEPERDTVATANRLWRQAAPIEGTPAAAYLFNRGITMKLPESLRFARLRYPDVGELPALVALVTTVTRKIGGVQRIFVAEDGRGKARVPTPRLSLGKIAGNAIRLGPPAREVIVTEGLEDALSIFQELGRVAWAAAGASMMAGMQFPDEVQSVVIGRDNDGAGEREAEKAAAAFKDRGLAVRIMRPAAVYKDFNHMLTMGRAGA